MTEQLSLPESSTNEDVRVAIQGFADALQSPEPEENQTKPYIMAELACAIDREQYRWHGPEYGDPRPLHERLSELGVDHATWSGLYIPNDDIIWASVQISGNYKPSKGDVLHGLLVNDGRITLTKPRLVLLKK